MKKVKKGKRQEKSERRAATFFRLVEEKLRSLLESMDSGRPVWMTAAAIVITLLSSKTTTPLCACTLNGGTNT